MPVASSSFLSPPPHLPKLTHRHQKHKPNRHRTISASLPQSPPNSDLLATVTNLLWGNSLPPHLLISTVRSTWTAAWQLMMKQLAPSDPTGSYSRPPSSFRLSPTSAASRPIPKTLHLYAALACPWAHRTLILRALKNLERRIPVSIASPGLDGSWEFRENGSGPLAPSSDRVNGRRTLKEVYRLRRGGYDGRSTIPMVWDVEKGDVFCNESYDIIEFFNSGVINGEDEDLGGMDLSPPELKEKIEYWNGIIYPNINNGVYRCGFAQSQEAYNMAVNQLFNTLEMLEAHLTTSRYLCGDVLSLADVCLFTTLIRFDLVYNVLFKCTKKKLLEYPNLHGYTRDIYQIPKVAETCNFDAIMDGYYRILFPLNPGSIRPALPASCDDMLMSKPHNRETLAFTDKTKQILV